MRFFDVFGCHSHSAEKMALLWCVFLFFAVLWLSIGRKSGEIFCAAITGVPTFLLMLAFGVAHVAQLEVFFRAVNGPMIAFVSLSFVAYLGMIVLIVRLTLVSCR